MLCPMQVVEHAVKTWSAVCSIVSPRNPVKERDSIVLNGQIESSNSSLQAIDLNPSCLKQAHSKRLGVGHGYESTDPGSTLTLLRVPSVIGLLGDTRLGRSIQLSTRPAVHNVLS